jgi:mono/diheme cytochrome c family protein
MQFLRHAVLTIVLLAVVAAVVVFVALRGGALAANQEPGPMERSIAQRLVEFSIPRDASEQQSPFKGDPETWRHARDHYLDHCAVCHGENGKGETDIGRNMYPRVPDFTSSDVQSRSDGALFYIIQNGVRWTGMPAWKGEHSPEDTWKLVAFIRKTPTLTDADLKRDETAKPEPPAHQHQHKQ